MKRNVGITDRIIRFVLFDLLVGAAYMGFEIPQTITTIAFLFSLSLLFTIIFGYSFVYKLFGISTRKVNATTNE